MRAVVQRRALLHAFTSHLPRCAGVRPPNTRPAACAPRQRKKAHSHTNLSHRKCTPTHPIPAPSPSRAPTMSDEEPIFAGSSDDGGAGDLAFSDDFSDGAGPSSSMDADDDYGGDMADEPVLTTRQVKWGGMRWGG